MSEPAEKLEQQNEAEDQQAIYDWLQEFSQHGELQVTLKRKTPKRHKGIFCGGTIAHYDEPIDEERIQEEHGGGKFQINVRRKNKSGSWKYAGSRTFEIAGTPKTENLINEDGDDDDKAPPPPQGEGSSARVLNAMESMVERAHREADQARTEGRQMDFSSIIAPFTTQLSQMQQIMADKDRQLFEAMSQRPDNGSDKVFDILRETTAGERNRLDAIRQQHDSELRDLRRSHQDDVKRIEDRHDRQLQSEREAHAREIASLKENQKIALETQKNSYEMRIAGLQETIKRLENDIAQLRTENTELRNKKEQGPVQQLESLVGIKSAFESLMPDNSKDEESGWQKAAGAVGPVLERLAAPYLGAGAQPQMQAPPQEDPLVTVQTPTGQQVQMRQSQVERMQQRVAEMQGEREEAEEPAGPQLDVDESTIQGALQYMEAAYRNGTAPEIFGESARSSIPTQILDFIRIRGVDEFLDNVAKLEASSPLSTVAGREYVRKVARYLLRGTVEAEQPQSSPEG